MPSLTGNYYRLSLYIQNEDDYIKMKQCIIEFKTSDNFVKQFIEAYDKYPELFKQQPKFL